MTRRTWIARIETTDRLSTLLDKMNLREPFPATGVNLLKRPARPSDVGRDADQTESVAMRHVAFID